jgi:hypothetical protein
MAKNVHVFILSGLGHLPSNGIIYRLAARLVEIEGVTVHVGSHKDWKRFADEARALPADAIIFLLGHSLGGSVLPAMARRIGTRVEALFGWDPADNIGANPTEYGLTPVPNNVQIANAFSIEGGFLGGGIYVAAANNDNTIITNDFVGGGHTNMDEAVEEHLQVVATVRRQAA